MSTSLPATASPYHLPLPIPSTLLPIGNNNTIVSEKEAKVKKSAKKNLAAFPKSVEASVTLASTAIRKSSLQEGEEAADTILGIGKSNEKVIPTSECISALNSYFAGSVRSPSGNPSISVTKKLDSDSGLEIVLNKMNQRRKKHPKSVSGCEVLLSDQGLGDVSAKAAKEVIDDALHSIHKPHAVSESDITPGTANKDSVDENKSELRIGERSPLIDTNSRTVDLTDDETPGKGRCFNTPPRFLDSDFPR